jgi:GNAT superfamily N-acetyltransferase
MKEIYLRKAILNDLPILLEFEQGIITAERPYDETLKTGHLTYYNIKAMIESIETEVIVAMFENEIVGSAYASIRKSKPYLKHSHYAYLGFMYVCPKYRGRGINQKIIDELKIWAQSRNIYEVRLDVYNDNHSAIRAYEKVGFEKHLINMRMEINKRTE